MLATSSLRDICSTGQNRSCAPSAQCSLKSAIQVLGLFPTMLPKDPKTIHKTDLNGSSTMLLLRKNLQAKPSKISHLLTVAWSNVWTSFMVQFLGNRRWMSIVPNDLICSPMLCHRKWFYDLQIIKPKVNNALWAHRLQPWQFSPVNESRKANILTILQRSYNFTPPDFGTLDWCQE